MHHRFQKHKCKFYGLFHYPNWEGFDCSIDQVLWPNHVRLSLNCSSVKSYIRSILALNKHWARHFISTQCAHTYLIWVLHGAMNREIGLFYILSNFWWNYVSIQIPSFPHFQLLITSPIIDYSTESDATCKGCLLDENSTQNKFWTW